jgi:hypothetical protein
MVAPFSGETLLNERLVAYLDELDERTDWHRPDAFLVRADAADRLDLGQVGLRDATLTRRVVRLLDALDAVDRQLYDALRERIRAGEGRQALAPWLDVGIPSGQHYDPLDALLAGVLALDEPLPDARPLPPEMVFYQPTPARHIVDGLARGGITAGDVVLDLGSGLGHVPLLVHILTGARCIGIERDGGYVDVATRAATSLGLTGVRFVEGDAREADFSGVDVFYLFTPFIGTVLRDVVARIEAEAARRAVRVVALGPCTRTFARQPWLVSDDPDPEAAERIVLFRSV